ncbi:MAG: hypothetical protein KGZ40_09015 [Clostridiales bacterium]|nr:hypothetical protein [Clostridiales bacterium]
MVRINLLPAEILEKRRFERQIRYVLLGGALVLVVLAGAYSLLMLQVNAKRGELQDRQQLEAELRSQAEAFAVFEQKESELIARQEAANAALAGRVNWGRLANEISLVLPAEVWLTGLQCSEIDGLTLSAIAVDSRDDVPDVGHKAVAKTLVRLADLEQITSVWLNTSAKAPFLDQPAIQFEISTGVTKPGSEEAQESSVPAPPESAQ